jgi:hypothetical protein
LQAVLDSIKENDFHGAFEARKKTMASLYVLKENILKEMAAKIEEVKPVFFYLARELSNTTSYFITLIGKE